MYRVVHAVELSGRELYIALIAAEAGVVEVLAFEADILARDGAATLGTVDGGSRTTRFAVGLVVLSHKAGGQFGATLHTGEAVRVPRLSERLHLVLHNYTPALRARGLAGRVKHASIIKLEVLPGDALATLGTAVRVRHAVLAGGAAAVLIETARQVVAALAAFEAVVVPVLPYCL